jgi:hypothetical protein
MKDENDKSTVDFVDAAAAAVGVMHEPAPGLTVRCVPVSFVAKDWGVSARRIRALLCAGRLSGRVLENGYWEVYFPYSFTFGTRGPALKRHQLPPAKPKKPELRAV